MSGTALLTEGEKNILAGQEDTRARAILRAALSPAPRALAGTGIEMEVLLMRGQTMLHYQEQDGRERYKMVSGAALKAAFAGEPTDSGWLPPGVVRWGELVRGTFVALWIPPRVHTIPVEFDAPEQEDIEAAALGVTEDIEAAALGVTEDIEAAALGVTEDIEAAALGVTEDIEAAALGVTEEIEAAALGVTEEIEAAALGVTEEIEAAALGVTEEIEAAALGVTEEIEAAGSTRVTGEGTEGEIEAAGFARVINVPSTPRRALVELQVPLPGLVMAGLGRHWHLWAIKGDDFHPDSPAFHPPLPNVYDGGAICWGSNTPPEAGAGTVMQAWAMFRGSPFNGHLAGSRSREYPNDVRAALDRHAGVKGRTWPVEDLVQDGWETVGGLINRLISAEGEGH